MSKARNAINQVIRSPIPARDQLAIKILLAREVSFESVIKALVEEAFIGTPFEAIPIHIHFNLSRIEFCLEQGGHPDLAKVAASFIRANEAIAECEGMEN